MSSTNTVVAVGVTPEKLANVRKWNIGLTVLHLGQAAAVLLLTNDFAIKILDSTPAGPPGTEGLVTSTLFEVRIGWVMAAFLALAGLDHLLTSTFARNTYESDLKSSIMRSLTCFLALVYPIRRLRRFSQNQSRQFLRHPFRRAVQIIK